MEYRNTNSYSRDASNKVGAHESTPSKSFTYQVSYTSSTKFVHNSMQVDLNKQKHNTYVGRNGRDKRYM